jgi:predicted aspartyl protease
MLQNRVLFGLLLVCLSPLLLLASCTPFRAVEIVGGGKPVQDGTLESTVSFTRHAHPILIEVRLNNLADPYVFIFDTGALTAVSKQVAAEIGLAQGIYVEGRGSGGKAETVELVQLDSIMVGDMAVEGCGAAIIDLRRLSPDIDGILGSNFLKHFMVSIDYQREEITLAHGARPISGQVEVDRLSFTTDMRYGFAPVVSCTVDGSIQAGCLVDTGTYDLALPDAMIKKTRAFSDGNIREARGSMGGGMFGDVGKSYAVRVHTIRIGSENYSDIVAQSHTGGDYVLLGNSFLENFSVTLSYPTQEMVLTPIRPFSGDKRTSFGVGLTKKGDATVVSGVWRNSGAARAGLEPGDRVVKINEEDASALSLMELMSLFLGDNSESITLEYVDKSGNAKSAVLPREMLLPPADR